MVREELREMSADQPVDGQFLPFMADRLAGSSVGMMPW